MAVALIELGIWGRVMGGGGGIWERGFFTNQATIKKGDVERVASGCTS